ncbi:MAG: hypothetical protein IPL46_06875 [Saprospiraceae bacterium]|nr:hypothetical protein [Saprospiraceae bacterium]
MNFVLDDIIDRFWKDGRIKDLEELSSQNAFDFSMSDRLDLQTYKIKNFHLFRGRKAKRIRGILSKQIDAVEVRIYDFVYYAESGKKKSTVIELHDAQLDLSPFIIRPKRSIQWVKEVFNKDTSFFPDQPGFHAYYELESPNKPALKNELTADFVELISSATRLSVEGDGPYMLIYHRGKVVQTREIMAMLDFSLDLLESLFEASQKEDLL